jgi:hypothetical protein
LKEKDDSEIEGSMISDIKIQMTKSKTPMKSKCQNPNVKFVI